MSHSYTYDPLYRLTSATGTYTGANNKTASYSLSMGYDNMHRITSKQQHLSQVGVQFDGTLYVGYDLTYTYGQDAGKKFQLDHVRDINYRTEEVSTESTNINNGHKYTYDANGNLVYINTSRVNKDGREEDQRSEKKYLWDEENRLLAVDENGFVSNYWYDADGERTSELTFVGHSLGGGLAAASSMKTGRKAITFNRASVSLLTKLVNSIKGTTDNTINYQSVGARLFNMSRRIGGDPLTNFQDNIGVGVKGRNIPVPTGLIPSHSIDAFLDPNLFK